MKIHVHTHVMTRTFVEALQTHGQHRFDISTDSTARTFIAPAAEGRSENPNSLRPRA